MGVTQTARIVATLVAVVTLAPCARADERRLEYAPEFNAFHNFSGGTRLYLLADTSKVEGREKWQNQLGVHLDISTKRALRERLHLADWARARRTGVRIGYRQMRQWDGEREAVHERRGLVELTYRANLPNKFAVANRFGFDYRELERESSQRYRYRIALERDWTAGRVVLVPYAHVELIYDTRYSDWKPPALSAGVGD